MPIFSLDEEITFPPVELSSEEGILAVGGDLSPERLIEAYRKGIFPWYSDNEPILWWSPDPRFVLFPENIYISRSMRKVISKNEFIISFDTNFIEVIKGCRKPRRNQPGTWITDEMLEAYYRLHKMGIAHSVEAWKDGVLAGGLYGISMGKCFFGESMFANVSNASKAAFITLTEILKNLDFKIIDCQVYTDHLDSLGAEEIERNEFLRIMNEGLNYKSIIGSWNDAEEFKGSSKL